MEFISNLIKRPVSLVSGGGEVTDKPQESPTSRPTTIGSFENEESQGKDLEMEKEQQQIKADSQPRPNSTSRPTTIGSLEDVEILQNKINSLENMEISQEELNSLVKGVQEMENMKVHQKAEGGGVVPMENKQQIKTNGKLEETAVTQKNCVVENSNKTQNENQDPIGCDLNQNETGDTNVTNEKSPDSNNHAKDGDSCDEQQKHLENVQRNVEQGKSENLKNEDQVLEGQNVSDDKQGDLKKDILEKKCEDTDNRDPESKNLNNPENIQSNVMEEKCTDLNNKDKVIEGQNISQEEINKDMLHKICQSTESKDQESENQTNPEKPQINVEDITQERAEEKATEIDNTNEEFKKCAASEEQGQMPVQTPTENEESNNSKNSQNIENRKSDAPSSNTEEKDVLDVTEEVEAKTAVGISQIPSNVKSIERELPNSQDASSEKQEDIINSPGAGEQEIPQQLKLEDISAINNQESCQNLNSPHQQSQIQENINKQKENEAQGNILTQNTLEESQTEVKSNDKEKKAEEIPLNLQDNSKGSSEPNRGSQENQSENNSNAEPQELQQTNKDLPNSCDEMPKPQIEISYYEHQEGTERPISSLSSSLNGNITDFIGVPEEILKEFDEEYLPPPPPPLLLPPDDDNSMQSQTPSPPPPPPVLTSSMTASQTIDELLSEITDNLTLAGINDEVLAIASPPQKSEHSPLSSKNSLNNSKTTPKTPTNNGAPQQTTAAGPAATSPAVFEANSTLHKFHVDPDLATGLFDDHQHQQQTAAMESQNTSGAAANKSSNKFVGLTEFDEAKIPELPGDLNPNIEDQYSVTFEECFIPTLTASLKAKELQTEKVRLSLPNEADNTSMSSANETFADCQDGNGVEDRDPLATTFAEQPALNTTVEVGDGECYESALLDDGDADATMDVGGYQTHAIEEAIASHPQQEIPASLDYEEEPMDVDMNATMEMIQNSAQNIENVEKAIQHAENILQNLEGPTQPIASKMEAKAENKEEEVEIKIIGSIAKPTESSKMTFVINPANIPNEPKGVVQHLEMEKSNHDISLNKSIELPLNKSKTLSSECVISAVNNEGGTAVEAGEKDSLDTTKESTASNSMDQKNLTINVMNTSNSSNASCKSPTSKLNVTTSLSTSTGSLKSSAPNSPSFPIKKTTSGSSFPQSPKLKIDSPKPTFLEKSDYTTNLENKAYEDASGNGDMNGTFVHPAPPGKNTNRRTFGVDQGSVLPDREENKRLTFNMDESSNNVPAENKRLTFNVQGEEVPPQLEQSNKTEEAMMAKARRTFNISSEEPTPMDTSYAPMDVDDNLPQNATMAIEARSNSPALDVTKAMTSAFNETRSQSPPLPTLQTRALQNQALANSSPPLPTMQKISNSPPLPTMQNRSQSPPLPAASMKNKFIANQSSESLNFIQKRPSIHGEILSEKEQSNIKMKDEKDIYYEKSTPSPMEEVFTAVSATSTTLTNTSGFSAFDQSSPTTSAQNKSLGQQIPDDEFQGNSNLILNPSDFDYLLTKGNNNTPVDRSSLLLKFDPLLGCPVPANQGQQTQQQQQQLHLQIPTNLNNNPCLSPTIEEDELNESTNRSFVVDNARTSLGSSGGVGGFGRSSVTGPALSSSAKLLKERSQEVKQQLLQQQQQNKRQLPQPGTKKNATMSVDVIKDMSLDNNDCNKTFENSNSTQPDDKQINYKMDELEKKVKNEVLKTEDIEKKLREAEQREEALIKRITEKDKTVAKMTGVIEAYEKAIAELIAEKEQLIQNYEKQLAEVKADRDSNYHHLTSLETTFSDLHVKYEKSKEMTCQLKGNEENLIAENRKNAENLRLQEQRYDKMKNHAMQQLEIANKKLEALAREHQLETTKLKALLKKEEIARSSMSEQLAQKSKENAELVKICDELISGQGS
uniref:Transforming acidic coiled-coil-containing protein (TACC) n=1 Tax=Musca domestica TaxID=7370 RepID=T1PLG7_MUSDO